ncbi:HAMP domain-containing sensor histidine kinase [Streptomyces sp. NPDC001904]|uniref:sensor histidine kinase n=1 Tax=Streptomyces sp. NPDC001904 TaxID=3154531 RepID=UPI00331E1DB3
MRPDPRLLVPRTLRGRLALVAVVAAALLLTTLTLAFDAVAVRHLRSQADDRLRGTLAAVASTVEVSGRQVRVRETSHDEVLDSGVWVFAGSRTVEQPASARRHPSLARAAREIADGAGARCVTAGETAGQEGWRLCAQDVSPRGAGVVAVAAVDMTPYASSMDALLAGFVAFGVVMLACTYVLTRLSVGRALRPVTDMTDRAARWSAVSSATRMASPTAPQELRHLGVSLDALLDRIRSMLRHEQRLTAELSHELRTPLARIVAELDLWRTRPRSPSETRRAHAVIEDAAASMRTICDTLLDQSRATAAESPDTPGTCQVDRVLRRLADTGPDGGVHTAVEVDAALRAGVAESVVERIVSPLHANALRHARSTVILSARATPQGVHIVVSDDGAGVPAAFAPRLFRPGQRADPADGHDGAGLGLALVRRLVRSAGGEVWHDASYADGARFVVRVPG